MSDQSKKPYEETGKFTQVPNVFFDTCDLPETAQILYLRIFRHIAYRDGKISGSVRKLSKLLRISKSTVQRQLKRLQTANLINITYEESDEADKVVMTITLKRDEIWALNKRHTFIGDVPNWDKVMPDCPNVGQGVPEMGQDDINLGQRVPEMGQSVPGASSNSGGNTTNTENTNNKENTEASPPIKRHPFIEAEMRTACKKLLATVNMESEIDYAHIIYSVANADVGEFKERIRLTVDEVLKLPRTNQPRIDLFFERLLSAYRLVVENQ
jgi:DNA-binding MarR family transcriptional regulator